MEKQREIIYIKADRNVEVKAPEVTIGDVVKIEGTNPNVLARIKSLKLLKFQNAEHKKQDRTAVSILKVIACIHEEFPQIEVQNLGEQDFIVTYEKHQKNGGVLHYLKVVLVVMISFTGAAFSIMSFNNDVDITTIFSQIHELTTGRATDGFTILEITYSLGIIIGILMFFNHFGKKRFTMDPTPIEVEMRLYENDLQTTMIEDYSRKGNEMDVGR